MVNQNQRDYLKIHDVFSSFSYFYHCGDCYKKCRHRRTHSPYYCCYNAWTQRIRFFNYLIQFTFINPYATAFWLIINFNPQPFGDDEDFLTMRTLHFATILGSTIVLLIFRPDHFTFTAAFCAH